MSDLPDQKLFALGPVNVPDVCKNVVPKPISHRSPSMFCPLFESLQKRVASVVGASQDVYCPMFINGSGTSGAEAIISSFKGRRVLMCSNGSFGEKWQKLAKQYAPNVTSFIFACGWAVPYNPDAIVAAAKKENCDTVMFVHHETSCGFVNKMKAIGRACAAADLLCFADCVSSFGVEEIVLGDGTDGITGITFSSNKGTMCYPGVSVVVARKDYCQKVDPMAVPMYLNLNGYYKFAETKK